MGYSVKLKEISFTVTVHATEDKSKVIKALLELIPEKLRKKISITETAYKGYYGNPITLLSVVVRGRLATEVLKYIIERMDDTSKKILNVTLDQRVDQAHRLHMRFSKQEAYQGRLILYDGDDIIKVILSFKFKGGIGELREYLKSIGMLSNV
ncbi:MAG TPA: exosome protein [Desulfurococcales archaeon]|nr:exosome protein [Desulfurococcales archaeon]